MRVELLNERETNARKVAQLEEDLEEVRSTRDQHAEVIGMLSREKTVERAIVEAIANADPTDPVSVLKIETTESGWQYALPAAIELTKYDVTQNPLDVRHVAITPRGLELGGIPRVKFERLPPDLDAPLTFRVEKLRPGSGPATVEITNLAERVDVRAELLERLASAARAVESEIKVDGRAWVPTGDGHVTTLSDWIRNHALRGPR